MAYPVYEKGAGTRHPDPVPRRHELGARQPPAVRPAAALRERGRGFPEPAHRAGAPGLAVGDGRGGAGAQVPQRVPGHFGAVLRQPARLHASRHDARQVPLDGVRAQPAAPVAVRLQLSEGGDQEHGARRARRSGSRRIAWTWFSAATPTNCSGARNDYQARTHRSPVPQGHGDDRHHRGSGARGGGERRAKRRRAGHDDATPPPGCW